MKKYIIAIIAIISMTTSLYAQNWLTNGNYSYPKTLVFGTTNKNAPNIIIKQKNQNIGVITKDGNFGFGTVDPKQKIHVVDGNILISANRYFKNEKGESAQGSTNGSLLFGADIEDDNTFGMWGIEYVNDRSNLIYGLNFWQPFHKTNTGQYQGPYNYVLFIEDCTGNIGIGTPRAHAKLTVNGNIMAKELIITKSLEDYGEDWPDFVFSKDYELMSLKDLENFINENNHLPNVPSAGEIKTDGIKVMEMNAILLQKVEELSLYIIDLQKQIDELKDN